MERQQFKKLNAIQLNLNELISFILRKLCLLVLGYNVNIFSSVILVTAEFLPIVLVRYVDIHTIYRGADKSLAQPGRRQATATGDFEFHMST
jgi:TRAP-type C4-dicarboxylate transport system permease large subunit